MEENSIRQYLAEVSEIPRLTPKEEIEITEKVAVGDENARRQLIQSNLLLVASIARQYQGCSSMTFLDLIQEGNIGLINATHKFNPQRGYKFSTCASWYIKQAISRSIVNKDKTIRLPISIDSAISKMLATEKKLAVTLGRQPSIEEISSSAQLTIAQVQLLKSYHDSSANIDSLQKENPETGDELLAVVPAAEKNYCPEECLNKELSSVLLNNTIATLSQKEQTVIKLRYGFADGVFHTLASVGDKLGISRERARQIEATALQKLRHPSRANQLRQIT